MITLVNDASVCHSIDFHAGARAPTGRCGTIPPGGRLAYRFTATRAGIWMYPLLDDADVGPHRQRAAPALW